VPSLDFEREKRVFRDFYDRNRKRLEEAKNAYVRLIGEQIRQSDIGEVTKIEGRVKEREECIKKFHRKYQEKLEGDEQPYEIRDFISDLIGIRIVCLYEDQIALVSEVLQRHYRLIEVTDKISAVESTEDSFGYKGLHMDLAPDGELLVLDHCQPFEDFRFEVQIRSLIQDAWSVLDHKIKYKKSIPNDLKRRINVLSALFELADREFKEIRNATAALIREATDDPLGETPVAATSPARGAGAASEKIINAFNFLRVAGHFFRDFEFEDYKVDGFVQDILRLHPEFTKGELHHCLVDHLKLVREYRDLYLAENADHSFSPYTVIRHCLYLSDPRTFQRILSRVSRERFAAFLAGGRD